MGIAARFRLTELDGHPGIAVSGELGEANCGDLESALREASGEGRSVALDLGECTFMDSKALDVVARAATRFWDDGGFRKSNLAHAETALRDQPRADFQCECWQETCSERISLSVEDWALVRSQGNRSLLLRTILPSASKRS